MTTTTSVQEYQRQVTRLAAQCALLLLQHGAESMLVEQLTVRLGRALGMDSVEIFVSAYAVVLTTIYHDHCLTTTRKNMDRGINMHVVTEVQHIVIQAEKQDISAEHVRYMLDNIVPMRYPPLLVVLMVGAACGCFCLLAGGGIGATLITTIVAAISMFVRQRIAHMQINPIINFGITAFVATSICGFLVDFFPVKTPTVAMAACILFLVPGFPLINAVSDMFKGHVNTGIARLTIATWLMLATCIGVVIAVSLFGLQGWG